MFHVKQGGDVSRETAGEMFHVKRSREGEMFHVKQKRVVFRCSVGACLLCRLPTMPLVYFLSPIPPTPFPRGEGGDFLFSYARGSAPCIPGAEPGRRWLAGGAGAPGAPAAKPARHWLFLPRQCFSAPIPPTPFPVGKGEIFVLFCRGLAPPAPLLLNPRGTGLPGGLRPLHPRG